MTRMSDAARWGATTRSLLSQHGPGYIIHPNPPSFGQTLPALQPKISSLPITNTNPHTHRKVAVPRAEMFPRSTSAVCSVRVKPQCGTKLGRNLDSETLTPTELPKVLHDADSRPRLGL
jgi:hypothetical protein